MEYKIGEVSKMLNISKEMIRYYEKKGALTPSRQLDNNYRTYNTMDIFLLMEIVRYQALDFGIKEISDLLSNHYMEKYANHLYEQYKKIDEEIRKKELLKERIKELEERAITSQFNVNHYWIKSLPAYDLVYMLDAEGDHYGEFNITNINRKALFENDYMAFFESMCLFEENKDTWWYGINQYYGKRLEIKYKNEAILPKAICLCTMVDMGEVGEYNRSCLNDIMAYANQKSYKVVGLPRGIIVCRGYENKKFQRIMEIQLPIEI